MSYRIWSVDTTDWTSKVRVYPSDFPYGRVLNGGKGGTATFKLGDPAVRKNATEENTAPWERMLVAEFQGLIVYAGFIVSDEYDYDTNTVTVNHEDLRAVLARRLVADLVANGVQTTALVYTGVTEANLIKQFIYQGQNDAARFNLPIALPADESGSANLTVDGYQLPTVASMIDSSMRTENGPDTDFFPRWRDDSSVEWLLRIGNLTEGTWKWDVSASKSRVSGLKKKRDGAKMANRVVAIGEGTGSKMKLHVEDGSAGSPFLPLDVVTTYKSEPDQGRLAARARADLAARAQPTVQISMDVQMDGSFAVHQLRLGGTVRWRTQGNPRFPDGWKASRLIEFSGNLDNKIHLEFQTAGG